MFIKVYTFDVQECTPLYNKNVHSCFIKVYILVIVLYSTKYRDKIQPSHSIAPSNKYVYILLKYALKRKIINLQIIDYNSKNIKIYVSNIKTYIIFADKELSLI